MNQTTGFEEFVRAHATELLRSATLLATGRDRGEELLQDTLTHLYPRWDRVAKADVPIAYVRRAMVNRLISTGRSPRNRELAMEHLPERQHAPDPATNVVDRQAIWQMLATLPERQRAAVVLRYFDDLPDDQIAEIIGCREVTVRSLVSRALAEMRQRDQLAALQEKAGS
jgi:RNA polymerase sigma-70 factor (sigma-E family)